MINRFKGLERIYFALAGCEKITIYYLVYDLMGTYNRSICRFQWCNHSIHVEAQIEKPSYFTCHFPKIN